MSARVLHDSGDCWFGCPWCFTEDRLVEDWSDIAICGGCGAYGELGNVHYRRGEECGEFV